VAGHYAPINANNFYDEETRINLELRGGEVLAVKVVGGSLGFAETQELVPEESGGMQKLSRAVSMAGPASQQQSSGSTAASAGGGGCFISAMGGNEQ
jgi:UDP-N-acetylglucosamine:LPS N-acetylglucosamine transferase